MKLHALAQAITLATLLSTVSFSAFAADIPLSAAVEADQVTTKVVSVDAAAHQVVLEGPEGRQVQVQLKITDIDVKKNKVTFENPAGKSKTVDVARPEVQAKLKDLKVGQSVVVTYTDILKVTSQH